MNANIIGLDRDSREYQNNAEDANDANDANLRREGSKDLDLDFLDKITLDSSDGTRKNSGSHKVRKKGAFSSGVDLENPVEMSTSSSTQMARARNYGLAPEDRRSVSAARLIHKGPQIWTLIPILGRGFSCLVIIFIVAMIFKPTPGGGFVPLPSNFGEAIDTKKDPCDGLYEYACGKWMDHQELPPNETRVSQWSRMSDDVTTRLSAILNSLDAKVIAKQKKMEQENNEVERAHAVDWTEKVRAVYSSCRRNNVSKQVPDQVHGSLSSRLGSYYKIGVDIYFSFRVMVNPSDQLHYFVFSSAGDKDLFEKPDIETILTNHAKKILEISDPKWDAELDAKRFVKIYRGISENGLSDLEFHDKTRASVMWDKVMTWEELGNEIGIDFETFWAAAGFPTYTEANPKVTVESQAIVDHIKTLFADSEKNAFLAYERASFFYQKGKFIDIFQKENEEYYRLVNHKVEEIETDNWKWCTEYMRKNMGWALSRLYVDQILTETPLLEEVANKMVNSMGDEIKKPPRMPWMDEKTKEAAKKKGDAMKLFVAFPSWIREFNKYFNKQMEEMYGNEDYGENLLEIDNKLLAASRRYEASQIGKKNERNWAVLNHRPIDDNENFYDLFRNMLIIPATNLHDPMIRANKKYAPLNWGSFASYLGHSSFHAFDEAGSLYGQTGEKIAQKAEDTWWTAGTQTEFGQVKKCIDDQYSGLGADKETTRENIAETAGLQLAYEKFQETTTNEESKNWNGLYAGKKYTPAQAFFISFAQMRCVKLKDPFEDSYAASKGIPLPHIVVNGAAMNNDAFAHAFKCNKGTIMNPAQKCHVTNG